MALRPRRMETLDFLSTIFGLYASCFCGGCFAWYADQIACRRVRFAPWLLAAAYAAWREGAPKIMPTDVGTGPSVIRVIVLVAVSTALLFLFYRPRVRVGIYVALSWAAILELAFFISYSVIFAADPIYDRMSEEILTMPPGQIEEHMNAIMRIAYVFEGILAAILSCLCIVCCRFAARNLPRRERDLSGAEFRLLMLPALTGLMMGLLLRMLIVTIADGVPMFLFDEQPALKVIVPAIAGIALLGMIYAVRTMRDMEVLENERRSRLVAEERLRALHERIGETERLNAQVGRMRHDLKNTLTVIAGLSQEIPEGAALGEYLSNLYADMGTLERQFDTGDPVADILLTSKMNTVRQTMPDVQLDTEELVLAPSSSVSSYDLGIILGNALDNALHAVSKQTHGSRFIRLRSFAHDALLCLIVQNSMGNGSVNIDREGFPISADGEGLGLRNIQSIAGRYGGTMDWKAQDGVFTLSVMLKMDTETATLSSDGQAD